MNFIVYGVGPIWASLVALLDRIGYQRQRSIDRPHQCGIDSQRLAPTALPLCSRPRSQDAQVPYYSITIQHMVPVGKGCGRELGLMVGTTSGFVTHLIIWRCVQVWFVHSS